MAKIGDTIKFRVLVREGWKTATRKIVGEYRGDYEVRFRGYSHFVVHQNEVLEITNSRAA